MKNLIVLLVAASIPFIVEAQHRVVSDFDLSSFEKTYCINILPADYSPVLRFDYEIAVECPDGPDDVSIRIPYLRIDRFRSSMNKLAAEYARWDEEGYRPADGRGLRSYAPIPKVDVYVYDESGWTLSPKTRLSPSFIERDGERLLVLESSEFNGVGHGKCRALLVFNSLDEINRFTSGLDPSLTYSYAGEIGATGRNW